MNGFVYFIADGAGLVKIGFTTDPARRLFTLQASSGRPLAFAALAHGNQEDERALHSEFSIYQVRGEWFDFSGSLKIRASEIGRCEVPPPLNTAKTTVGTRLAPSLRLTLEDLAEASGVTLSAYIEIALEEHVAKKERQAA